ncbi:Lsr2 family DNA-binding protein [Arthrobacter sp. U41]|uniref:Lsr2 family DNA-binding protein n=1 Tax=Arthrobacter sp. U41 TaxID=1849032 RepID=UPI0009F677D8
MDLPKAVSFFEVVRTECSKSSAHLPAADGRQTRGAAVPRQRCPARQALRPCAIRRWAIDNGCQVISHGTIPVRIAEAFQSATS